MKGSSWLFLATTVLLVGCDATSPMQAPLSPSMEMGGNADAAHACQRGGYLSLMEADGTKFANVGACVSYAAGGGTLTPLAVAPVITSFALTGSDPNGAIVTAVFSGAPSGIVTIGDFCGGPSETVASGVPTVLVGTYGGNVLLTVTNVQGSAQAQISLGDTACP